MISNTGMRAPNAKELSWLNYTSLAYGAQGISYFCYFYQPYYDEFKEKAGQLMYPNGKPTPLYDAIKRLNPQFVAVASQLKSLRSLGAYHVGRPWEGVQMLPEDAPFRLDLTEKGNSPLSASGVVLGYFGKENNPGQPTHVVVANLDYNDPITTTIVGPGPLSTFDATTKVWKKTSKSRVTLTLPPGGGVLVQSVSP